MMKRKVEIVPRTVRNVRSLTIKTVLSITGENNKSDNNADG